MARRVIVGGANGKTYLPYVASINSRDTGVRKGFATERKELQAETQELRNKLAQVRAQKGNALSPLAPRELVIMEKQLATELQRKERALKLI